LSLGRAAKLICPESVRDRAGCRGRSEMQMFCVAGLDGAHKEMGRRRKNERNPNHNQDGMERRRSVRGEERFAS